jgi:hypothetical protein
VIRFNGSSRTTTYVKNTRLTATIPASDISTDGVFNITVFNPAPGGGASGAQTFTVNNPVPAVTSISPASKNIGDVEFIMTVNGTNFVVSSEIRFNGSSRTTTYVSDTLLTATIPDSDLTTDGAFEISVFNPTPVGGESSAQVFTVSPYSSTGTLISGKNGMEDVKIIAGQTTACTFKNELMRLKIKNKLKTPNL